MFGKKFGKWNIFKNMKCDYLNKIYKLQKVTQEKNKNLKIYVFIKD